MQNRNSSEGRISIQGSYVPLIRFKKSQKAIRTLKELEQQQAKQQFFDNMIEQLDRYLDSQQKLILTQQISNMSAKRTKKIIATQKSIPISVKMIKTENSKPEPLQDRFLKIVDPNLFAATAENSFTPKSPLIQIKQSKMLPIHHKIYASCSSMKVPTKLRLIDQKMREQYDKARKNFVFYNPKDQNQNWHSIRCSMDSKTQHIKRNQRFATQSLDCSNTPVTSVPKMLFGQMLTRTSTAATNCTETARDDRMRCLMTRVFQRNKNKKRFGQCASKG